MKKFMLLTIFISGCSPMFKEERKLRYSYELSNDTSLQVYAVGHGATTTGYIEVREKTRFHEYLIKVIDGYTESGEFKIRRLDDTLFTLTYSDTAVFKRLSTSYQFNINNRVNY
ncbi:MAG: hypothetical protein JSU01_06425 [Bacteroidetes bacterium]|nr:hypothetical protein [Bacteroidota bacterium]